jgi:hypothetical protein
MLAPMPADLDPADLAEVRRRVVDPALAAMFHPGELDEVRLGFESPGHRGSMFSISASAGPREVTLSLTARGELYTRHLADATFERGDAEETLARLLDDLGDWIAESSFGWAQWRRPAAPVVPPPADGRAEQRVAEVYPGAEPFPVYENGSALDPEGLHLAAGLVAALAAWRTQWERLMRSLPVVGEPEEPWEPPFEAAYASGLTLTFVTDEEAARIARARAVTLAEADAAWREVVDVLESGRDALVERLRAELGPAWHVPTPPRIP